MQIVQTEFVLYFFNTFIIYKRVTYSDAIWKGVADKQKRKLGIKSQGSDGEFWMSFDDFVKQFEEISICTIGPDFNSDGIVDLVEKVENIYFHIYFLCRRSRSESK